MQHAASPCLLRTYFALMLHGCCSSASFKQGGAAGLPEAGILGIGLLGVRCLIHLERAKLLSTWVGHLIFLQEPITNNQNKSTVSLKLSIHIYSQVSKYIYHNLQVSLVTQVVESTFCLRLVKFLSLKLRKIPEVNNPTQKYLTWSYRQTSTKHKNLAHILKIHFYLPGKEIVVLHLKLIVTILRTINL